MEEGATLESHSSAPGMTGSRSQGFVGKGLTLGLASPPAPVAGNSWWVLCGAGELSSPKEVLANTRPGRDKERWVSPGSRFHEPWGEQCPAQQGQKGHPSCWIAPQKNPPQKGQGPFASGNPINCFRKWKSVPANGAVIDRRFSLQRPSGDKVNSNVI